ncbi:hypothetical protein ASPCADRAFT_208215 [Aspergillus carbonarius ITEM 5010]|uniref:Uncharacterized protein n=1 Tax=Aspergillus carbonarius (strain ITEM 5010) TaxID=602072 RepID=A0A1R3RJ89_ASPC5|nr:hypothetical protein ASPCADRAFT_208215 [Aspergillus carbonarius ITEM 5010]
MSTLIQNPDYAPTAPTHPLPLKLYIPRLDGPSDIFIKHTLESLVTGHITPPPSRHHHRHPHNHRLPHQTRRAPNPP